MPSLFTDSGGLEPPDSSFYQLRGDISGEPDRKVVISDREMDKWSQPIER